MKTLHLTNAWHAASGGIATFYRALLRASETNGHFMRLVVPSDRTEVEDLGRFTRIYHLCAPRTPLNKSYRMLLPHRFLFPGTALSRILADERPDLVEVSDKYTLNYFAGCVRRGWIPGVDRRPAVVGLSCERMDDNVEAYLTASPAGKAFARWYMKWLYFPLFDHHITVSEHTAGELRIASKGHRVRRGVWVRPMGVDADAFTARHRTNALREFLCRRAGGNSETFLLLYSGRLAAEKNLRLLIDTMDLLIKEADADYRLLVAGEGTLGREFEQECERRNPGVVTFLGHTADRRRLADLYANCDVFVHPNPREPFGIAPLEAMASGLPLVAPNTGGVTGYANDTNAWLADPEPAAFAAAVRAALLPGELRKSRLRSARQKAEQHDWARVGECFLSLYHELHAISIGRTHDAGLKPAFVSTSGNWLGMEVPE